MFLCYLCLYFFTFLVIDTEGWLAGIWHQPPPSGGRLLDFPSRPILFSPLTLFCIALVQSKPHTPNHCLCMTVAVMGSKCLGASVSVSVCISVCAPRSQTCPAVHPWSRPERGARPSGVALCVRMRWVAASTPGLCPGRPLTKQEAGAGFVFNCDIWGVFARSLSPHPLSLTFCSNNSLISPSSPPTPYISSIFF